MTQPEPGADVKGLIFDLDTFAIHDGPGIRMAVYLKGCQLSCQWCHSPESISPQPELILLGDRCVLCGACQQACAQDAHEVNGSRHSIRRDRCVLCRRCVENCPAGALEVKGHLISAREIVERAVRLRPFFDHSGGGVTLTGGEVTCQLDFALALLQGCRDAGIHTAIETNGACLWEDLARLLPYCGLVLYDLKLMDDAAHRKWTGASSRQILENAARLGRTQGCSVQVRVPLIPDITDTDENLRGLFSFVHRVGLRSLSLLPFNASAAAKYEWLGRPFEIAGEPQSADRLEAVVRMAREAGLEAAVSAGAGDTRLGLPKQTATPVALRPRGSCSTRPGATRSSQTAGGISHEH